MARTEDVTILITGATDGLGERVATKRPAAPAGTGPCVDRIGSGVKSREVSSFFTKK
ncbi:MAG TPA: hypothetical protein VL949_11065 [Geobacteraceae bacterium]|nr:hypothetical protein [Geobacteraceae bacterium]